MAPIIDRFTKVTSGGASWVSTGVSKGFQIFVLCTSYLDIKCSSVLVESCFMFSKDVIPLRL